MKGPARLVARLLGVVVACVPLAFVGTFALTPLWGWIERRLGVESLGHSGPADWCFWTIYALLVGAASALIVAAWRRPPAPVPTSVGDRPVDPA